MLEGHLAFCQFLGELTGQIEHVVRISCMGRCSHTAHVATLLVGREGLD